MFSGISLTFALCFNFLTWVAAQDCPSTCQCPDESPQCPVGVSLVMDACRCCAVCAKQMGELCTDRDVCDPAKSLYCHYSSPNSHRTGICTAQKGAQCLVGGKIYNSGEEFEKICKYRCRCIDGAIGCVPYCAATVRLPSEDCPMPRQVKIPGQCCEEWICESPTNDTFVGPVLPAYREEETYGPDLSQMRENCLVQTTEWSACSKTCGLGISTRVTNDNRECRLEKQSRLCIVRPCESQLEEKIKKGKKCIRTARVSKPMKFEVSGCTTTKAYRPKFCGVCTDGRCCTPHRTTTLPVEFKCPEGGVMKRQMMFIKTCACHYNCPSENDIFESIYYKKMVGDMA